MSKHDFHFWEVSKVGRNPFWDPFWPIWDPIWDPIWEGLGPY